MIREGVIMTRLAFAYGLCNLLTIKDTASEAISLTGLDTVVRGGLQSAESERLSNPTTAISRPGVRLADHSPSMTPYARTSL